MASPKNAAKAILASPEAPTGCPIHFLPRPEGMEAGVEGPLPLSHPLPATLAKHLHNSQPTPTRLFAQPAWDCHAHQRVQTSILVTLMHSMEMASHWAPLANFGSPLGIGTVCHSFLGPCARLGAWCPVVAQNVCIK